MRYSPCQDESYSKKLQRKEIKLKKKEKELMKKDRVLQRKISKYKRQKYDKAKADLQAAAKLKHAKRKLLFALDTRDQNTKRSKSNKRYKTEAKSAKKKTKVAEKSLNPFHYLNGLINRPCRFSRQASTRRFTTEPPDSCYLYLQRLFGRPCSYKHMFRPCRCGQEAPSPTKQSYWEKAAGDCYLISMRRPPLFIPPHVDAKRQCKNCGYILLFLAGILIWTPCLLCIELCKCCFCACCTDC